MQSQLKMDVNTYIMTPIRRIVCESFSLERTQHIKIIINEMNKEEKKNSRSRKKRQATHTSEQKVELRRQKSEKKR